MGNELGHFREWDEEKPLDWFLLDYPRHLSFRRYIQDLNHIYSHYDALWENDYGFNGFKWIEVDNHDQSIYSYYRVGSKSTIIVVLNMTPVSYERYDVGVPEPGTYIELINSERDIYEGCNMTNYVAIDSSDDPLHQQPHRIQTRLAPFAAVMFIKDTYK
ncbi:alpha amylase C-terminal domain-containing protein [Erysipelothrix inopinata]|uniref:Alpha amylase C-terminal domain-containing protein n=2 Tax=Erysipelothrix inopinata TaxID=225084 RepID=A0A7G9RYX2_9FIRM|nr:alpha amylase C-terminal domain-containing protein [Erysipelothrix inopinata]